MAVKQPESMQTRSSLKSLGLKWDRETTDIESLLDLEERILKMQLAYADFIKRYRTRMMIDNGRLYDLFKVLKRLFKSNPKLIDLFFRHMERKMLLPPKFWPEILSTNPEFTELNEQLAKHPGYEKWIQNAKEYKKTRPEKCVWSEEGLDIVLSKDGFMHRMVLVNEDILGSTMQAKGGKSTSEKKAAAARLNGCKPKRPRIKPKTVATVNPNAENLVQRMDKFIPKFLQSLEDEPAQEANPSETGPH